MRYGQLLVGMLCGGLGGSVFTWYVNRPKPAVISYRVNTTILKADPVRGLVPNLHLKIDDYDILVIETQTLEFTATPDSYVDNVDLAIAFPRAVHVFGEIQATPPSSIQQITCRGMKTEPMAGKTGLRSSRILDYFPLMTSAACTLSHVSPGSTYTIALATEETQPPSATVVAKNVQLINAEELIGAQQRGNQLSTNLFLIMGVLTGMVIGLLGEPILILIRRLKKRAPENVTGSPPKQS